MPAASKDLIDATFKPGLILLLPGFDDLGDILTALPPERLNSDPPFGGISVRRIPSSFLVVPLTDEAFLSVDGIKFLSADEINCESFLSIERGPWNTGLSTNILGYPDNSCQSSLPPRVMPFPAPPFIWLSSISNRSEPLAICIPPGPLKGPDEMTLPGTFAA